MKVLVLDDTHKKNPKLREALDKKKLDAALCSSSNEFLTAVDSASFDTLFINAETWSKGRAIYDYFDIAKKIETKPVVFYNTEESFVGIKNRKPGDQDKVHLISTDLETVFS
ncbi:MAG: hypothetical protein LBI42_10275 [Chitinispirillales bacterium]|jgi:PleD family two-component response regulator|nr:hypothetical protein [Chitinispirillales bacterium]